MKKCLSSPIVYECFKRLLGTKNASKIFITEYLCLKTNNKILDIGCGTASIIDYLPRVDYVGFDMSESYINTAKNKYHERGRFFIKEIGRDLMNEFMTNDYDVVTARGVLHHLDDVLAIKMFEFACKAMKPSGKLVTLDGCYIDGQSSIAQYILSKDRGKYVRNKENYQYLALKVFPHVKLCIRSDLLRIPYTHIIMECYL